MRNLLLNAVVALSAVGLLASCSSMASTAGSDLKVLPKSKATAYARGSLWQSSAKLRSGFLPAEPSVAVKQSAAYLPKDKHGMPTYSHRQRVRLARSTAYSCAENEVGAYGNLNAAGTQLKYGRSVRSAAADWSVDPVGTTFKIKGLPHTYVVDDYGSSLAGTNTIDIYHPNLISMKQWGTRNVEINVIHWGSWERTVNLLRGRIKYPHCAQMYAAARRKIASGVVAQTRGSAAPSL